MAEPNPKEQREAERFPVNTHTVCSFASPVLEDFAPLRITNISTKGVGLVSNEKLPVGLLMAVTLANPAKRFSKTVLVRVVHVTAQSGGAFLVGGIFESPITYEELCLFVM